MTAKDELKQYKNKIKEVDRSIKEYEKFMTRATKMTSIMSEMTARSNLPSDKVGDNATKMADLAKEYEARWHEAERTRIKLIDEINKVDGLLGTILYDIYIEGLSLEQTAQDIHYSYERTAHLHRYCFASF